MNKELKKSVLREFARRYIPSAEEVDLWPSIHGRVLETQGSRTAASRSPQGQSQLQAQPSSQTKGLTAEEVVSPQRARWNVGHSRQWRPVLSVPAVMISLVMVLVLGSLMLYSGAKDGHLLGIPLPGQHVTDKGQTVITNFVPAGMVRHLVISSNTVSNRQDQEWIATGEQTQETWYTQGKAHLLMKSAMSGWEENQGKDSTFIWVTEDAIYLHERWNNLVTKYPFNPYYLQIWGPSPGGLDTFLKQPPGYDYQVAERTILRGRPVAKLAHIPSTAPQPDASPTPVIEALDSEMRVESYAWFDTEEHRPLQYEYISRYSGGQMEGLVITNTARIIEDEMLERSSLLEDFFTFKMPAGAELKEGEKDPFAPRPARK